MKNFFDYSDKKETTMYYIPCGFAFGKKEITVNTKKAKKMLLSSSERHRISSAEKSDNSIILTKHYYTCPKCGFRIPAYNRYIGGEKADDKVAEITLERFLSGQMTLFEDELEHIAVNAPVYNIDCLHCPQCGYRGETSDRQREFIIKISADALRLSYELDLFELSCIKWLPNDLKFVICDAIYESISFDLAKGVVCIELIIGENTLASLEISCACVLALDDPLLYLIENDRRIQKLLRESFEKVSSVKLPFYAYELCFDKYILLTRFVGYPRAFYNAIPLSLDPEKPGKLDGSFEAVSTKLHKYSDVPALYDVSALPQIKSIRKLFFEKPELFFYIREAEILWELFQDPNLLMNMLCCNNTFNILSFLHRFNNTLPFLSMLKAAKGKVWLCRKMIQKGNTLLEYGIPYCAMNAYAQQEERRLWVEQKQHCSAWCRYRCNFSIPLTTPHTQIYDCMIGNYLFSRLRSTYEMHATGNALKNCLSDDYFDNMIFNNTIIAVTNPDGNYSAAIEVEGNTVLQVRGYRNHKIDSNPALKSAFEKWCTKFHLEMHSGDMFQ